MGAATANTTASPQPRGGSGAATTSIPKKKGGSFVPLILPERLVQIREGQRKIASILFVSMLPSNMIEVMKRIQTSMEDQMNANELVDAVIQDECHYPLICRKQEQEILLSQTRIALRTQNDTIREGGIKYFQFFTKLRYVVDSSLIVCLFLLVTCRTFKLTFLIFFVPLFSSANYLKTTPPKSILSIVTWITCWQSCMIKVKI